MAEIALVGAAVPRAAVNRVGRRTVPFYEVFRDYAAGVPGPHKPVDLVAVEMRGVRTGTVLQMMSHPRGCGEALLAEGAWNCLAEVGLRLQMHANVVEILKRSAALRTVVMFLNLVLGAGFLVGPHLVALGTLPVEVVSVVHMLIASTLAAERLGATVALEIRRGVTRRPAVIVTGAPTSREGLVTGIALEVFGHG